MIIGNEDRTADANSAPVEMNGRKYWPSYQVGKMHMEHQGDVRVIRWVKGHGQFMTMYC